MAWIASSSVAKDEFMQSHPARNVNPGKDYTHIRVFIDQEAKWLAKCSRCVLARALHGRQHDCLTQRPEECGLAEGLRHVLQGLAGLTFIFLQAL